MCPLKDLECPSSPQKARSSTERPLASAGPPLPTPFPLGKPQQVTVLVLVQQDLLFALCKEVTITSDTKCHLGSGVT